MVVTGLEPLIIAKIAAVIKGAAIASAHHGALVSLAQHFVAVAHSSGIVAGLQWLIAALEGVGFVAGLVALLEGLLEAIETGEPRKVIVRAMEAIEAAAGR
ncbi:hypothetical protein [Actinokineospora inagensis]|uniref:hypothetical protein n=1 Tax=Actinokineospora inagensis TaxID=103730 RepID=UPI0004046E49|nr:hypothetical protein [Actinokineospora inagensis]